MTLHRGLRQGISDICCGCCESIARWILGAAAANNSMQTLQPPRYDATINIPSPLEMPHTMPTTASCDLSDIAAHLKPPLPPAAKYLPVIFLINY